MSTVANIQGENGQAFALAFHKALAELDGTPSAIMCNGEMKAVLEFLGKYNGRYQETTDSFGRYVASYAGIPIVDLGKKAGSNNDVIKTSETGETSIYFARFGLDGFHAVSLAGQAPVKIWLPDFTTAGAVKKGEVEMISAVALKATKSAGVFRKIKIA